jgi:diguanylate cyclase (GGDEF)-like protein
MFSLTTGLTIWCTQALTFAGVLLLAWRHDRSSRHYLIWSLGLICAAAGIALQALQGTIPNIASTDLASALILVGQASWTCGFAVLGGRPIPRIAALPVMIWLGGVFLPWIHDDLANRVTLFYLANAVGAAILVRAIDPLGGEERAMRLPLAIVVAVLSIFSFSVALMVALYHPAYEGAAQVRAFAAFGHASLHLVAVTLCVRLLMARSERRWRALSSTDVLTSVLNRRGLQECFSSARARAGEGQFAALLFDLDHFKAINDRYGHQAGDHVLTAFARLAHRLIPRKGIFGRMGGEEFTALVPVEDRAEAVALAEHIRAQVCQVPATTEKGSVPVTVSVGVAVVPASDADWDRLVCFADRALYAAKNAGRNCVMAFDETAAAATTAPPEPAAPNLQSLDDRIHALRRIGRLSRS